MEPSERLAYYKRLIANGIALSAGQQADMIAIIKDRGNASAGPLPAEGAKHQEAKKKGL
jgi:hypothetical protein